MDRDEQALLAETFRKTMAAASGSLLDLALTELGWLDLLAEQPGAALPLAFGLLGETGAQAPLLNDVLLTAAGRPTGGTLPLPYTGGFWVVWDRTSAPGGPILDDLPLRRVDAGEPVPAASLAAGRQALGWWLTGASRAMLALARAHALDRVQFGRTIASFQAVRHRLAETLVAIEGAEATLTAARDDLGALLAKAAAGQAALTAARHCQQVLGGIGFTAEHALHRHVRRVLVLDGLLGSSQDLIREAGEHLGKERTVPRLIEL
jgi:hypothetical protein